MGVDDKKWEIKAEFLGESRIPLEIPDSNGKMADVVIKMSLLLKEWRLTKGAGGSVEAKKRKIEQNRSVLLLSCSIKGIRGSNIGKSSIPKKEIEFI